MTDILDLRQFYATSLGGVAERSIAQSLSAIWSPMHRERLVGLGYATPYLDRLRADTERCMALMPAAQGAVQWPHGEPNASALVFEEDLPLPDSAIDRVLMVHALEHCENAREALSEIWRILSPGGKVVIVVPNRRGVWARMEHTPFGSGKPYSGGQLTRLLRETSFTPTAWGDCLHFPPGRSRMITRAAGLMDRLGRRYLPVFAGVIVVEATKHLVQGIPLRRKRSRRVFTPVLAPQGARFSHERVEGRERT